MTNELTPPGAPGSSIGLAESVVRNRSTVATLLVALGILFLGLGVYCFYKAYVSLPPTDAEKDATAEKPQDPALPEVKLDNPRKSEYLLGGGLGVLAAIVGIGLAAFVGLSVPRPTRAEQLAEARTLILLTGALFGLVLMLSGLAFFVLWFDSLTEWIEAGKVSEAKWILPLILVFLVGAGLAFLAAQPARADERDNPLVRRFVYGTNVGLTVMLVILALIVGNVFAALKIPNKLDTTESGLNSVTLSVPMRDYLTALPKTVRIHAILTDDDPVTTDIRRLLETCKEVNPNRFLVRYLSPVSDQRDIVQLRNKYPQVEIDRTGLLFVLDENEKVATYVRKNEFEKQERDKTTFVGQARLAQEILFLTEEQSESVIYFTHESRELNVAAAEGPEPEQPGQRRPATELRTALESARCRVRRLPTVAAGAEVKIPDDAGVIVIADPLGPIPEKTEAAIRKYMTTPRPNGKKGKLLVLTGANPRPAGAQGVMATGLETLLAEFGIQLPDMAVYAEPAGRLQARSLITIINPNLLNERNEIALSFDESGFLLENCRPIISGQSQPGVRAQPLLLSDPQRYTWIETEVLPNPELTWSEIIRSQSREMISRKQVARVYRPLGAVATEQSEDKQLGRVVVIGSGTFADNQVRSGRSVAAQVDLFAASVNWLRERPAVANIPAKRYDQYTPPQSSSEVRVYWFPVALTLGGILALGVGVWVLRRK